MDDRDYSPSALTADTRVSAQLIIIRLKYKIPAFPAKAGENHMVFQHSCQILKKAQFPAFPAGLDTL